MDWRTLVTAFRATGQAGAAAATLLTVAVIAVATGFFDTISLLITLGGSLAVAGITFPRARLWSTWEQLTRALAATESPEELIAAVKRLARAHRADGPRGLERAADAERDPLLRRGVVLALECSDERELRDVLAAEARLRASEGEAARQVLLTLGKLFPAFGLIGTLIGLGVLMRNLSTADVTAIGPGLGIAVLTTLYGAVLANVVVLPLATKLQAHLAADALRTQMTIDGVMMVYHREYPTRIERALRAYVGAVAAAPAVRAATLVEHHAA